MQPLTPTSDDFPSDSDGRDTEQAKAKFDPRVGPQVRDVPQKCPRKRPR